MGISTILRALTGKTLAVALGLAVLSNSAFAGLISSVQMFGTEAGTGPGLGSVSVPVIWTQNIDNDNQTGGGFLDNNITVPIKRFDNTGDIDIVFNVTPTNGVTEYKVFESVDNNTGINWAKYTMTLGFGVGASFTPSLPGDGLDFDAPTYDTPPVSSAFANVATANEDVLVFSNGTHGSGSETYQFRIDVPNLRDVAGATAPLSFTLRQTPIAIPEPGSCLLLLCALSCLWIFRKHRS
jgi:hypothetical protein